jgi:hypothetical protein
MLENEEKIPLRLFNFQIDIDASNQLKKGAVWAKFFGIVGLCLATFGILLIIYAMIAFGYFFSVENRVNHSVGYAIEYALVSSYIVLLIATILFLISSIYLITFSSLIANAVENEKGNLLSKAFRSLRITFILWSICVGLLLLFVFLSLQINT